MPDINEQIRAYHPLIARCTYKWVGRSGAEYDDLFQMGQIAVWHAIEAGGITPAYIEVAIEWRMRDYVRMLRSQIGGTVRSEAPDHIPFDENLDSLIGGEVKSGWGSILDPETGEYSGRVRTTVGNEGDSE